MRSSYRLAVGLLLLALLVAAAAGHSIGRSEAPYSSSVGASPVFAAIDAQTGRTFVTNYEGNTVSVLDAATGRVVRTVAIGHQPAPLLVDGHTGRAFVLNLGDNSVSILNATTGAALRTVQLRHVVDLAVDEPMGHVFVEGGDQVGPGVVYMLDARSGSVLRRSPIGARPQGVAVATSTHRAFVTNVLDDTVSVIDTASGRVTRTVAVGATPIGVAVDDRAARVFVTNSGANSVSMLDARTGALLRTVTVGKNPQTLAVSARSGRVFVINDDSATVSVLDARTGAVVQTVPVGAIRAENVCYTNPIDVAVDERLALAFIINGGAPDRHFHATKGSVSVLDARSGRVLRTLTVGPNPVGLAVDALRTHLLVVNNGPGDTRDEATTWGWVPQGVRPWLPWIPRPPLANTGSVTVLNTSQL